MFLADAPGFGDSNIYTEIPNMTLVYEVMKVASHVTIALVLKGSSFECEKGKTFIQMMTSISRILSAEGIDQSKLVLLPLINEASELTSQKRLEHRIDLCMQLMDLKKAAIDNQDFNAEVLSTMNSSNYPSYAEMDQVKRLM